MKHTARRLSEAQCKQVKMVVVCQTLKILQVERTIQFKCSSDSSKQEEVKA